MFSCEFCGILKNAIFFSNGCFCTTMSLYIIPRKSKLKVYVCHFHHLVDIVRSAKITPVTSDWNSLFFYILWATLFLFSWKKAVVGM